MAAPTKGEFRAELVRFLTSMANSYDLDPSENREAEELLAAMHEGNCPDCNEPTPCRHYPERTI